MALYAWSAPCALETGRIRAQSFFFFFELPPLEPCFLLSDDLIVVVSLSFCTAAAALLSFFGSTTFGQGNSFWITVLPV